MAEARLARADVRKLIKVGHDPVADRRQRRAANAVAATGTFSAAAEAWLAKRKGQWSRVHYATSRRALERDVLPYIGNLPIVGIFAAELKQWRTMTGGRGFLFPSPTGNGDHITKESLSKAYKKTLGLTAHSVHGWRSSFSTLAKDAGGFDKVAVELTLDHVGDVKIVRTYDRGERLSERRRLAEWWANSLIAAQRGSEPIPSALAHNG